MHVRQRLVLGCRAQEVTLLRPGSFSPSRLQDGLSPGRDSQPPWKEPVLGFCFLFCFVFCLQNTSRAVFRLQDLWLCLPGPRPLGLSQMFARLMCWDVCDTLERISGPARLPHPGLRVRRAALCLGF